MKPLPVDAVQRRAEELLRRYPYDPRLNPAELPTGSPERLRGVPEGLRESMAAYFARNEARWAREEELNRRRLQGKPELVTEDVGQDPAEGQWWDR